jgi:hypothetical protein
LETAWAVGREPRATLADVTVKGGWRAPASFLLVNLVLMMILDLVAVVPMVEAARGTPDELGYPLGVAWFALTWLMVFVALAVWVGFARLLLRIGGAPTYGTLAVFSGIAYGSLALLGRSVVGLVITTMSFLGSSPMWTILVGILLLIACTSLAGITVGHLEKRSMNHGVAVMTVSGFAASLVGIGVTLGLALVVAVVAGAAGFLDV